MPGQRPKVVIAELLPAFPDAMTIRLMPSPQGLAGVVTDGAGCRCASSVGSAKDRVLWPHHLSQIQHWPIRFPTATLDR